MRQQRYERMKQMDLIKPGWQLTPRDSFVKAWSADVPDRDWEIANMEVYAAMVDLMDQGIGKVVDALQEKGQLDNISLHL